jgi:cytochrome c biogenesis protein CcmG/thiol:disulfide interchange protein DsbE
MTIRRRRAIRRSCRCSAAIRGKYVVLNMFASWCPPCHSEAPLIATEQRFLTAHGAVLIGLAYKDLSSSTEQFDRTYGLHEPVLRDVSGNFARSFGTYQVPETFVIDPQGKIIALERQIVSRRWLQEHVQSVIDKRS